MIKERWIEKDGSIFVEKEKIHYTQFHTTYEARKAVAFNLNKDVARHIVKLHNASINTVKIKGRLAGWIASIIAALQHKQDT